MHSPQFNRSVGSHTFPKSFFCKVTFLFLVSWLASLWHSLINGQRSIFGHTKNSFSSFMHLVRQKTHKTAHTQAGLGHGQLSLDWSSQWTGCCRLIKLLNASSFSTTHTNSIVNFCQFQPDQGPDNMALASYLKYHRKLYVVFLWDLIHETVNSVDRALQKCKLDNVVQELLLAWKLPWGPWSNLNFHSKIRGAAQAFSQIAKNSCDNFFLWLGEKARLTSQDLRIPAFLAHMQLNFSTKQLAIFLFQEVDLELQDRSLLQHVWESKGTRLESICSTLH